MLSTEISIIVNNSAGKQQITSGMAERSARWTLLATIPRAGVARACMYRVATAGTDSGAAPSVHSEEESASRRHVTVRPANKVCSSSHERFLTPHCDRRTVGVPTAPHAAQRWGPTQSEHLPRTGGAWSRPVSDFESLEAYTLLLSKQNHFSFLI